MTYLEEVPVPPEKNPTLSQSSTSPRVQRKEIFEMQKMRLMSSLQRFAAHIEKEINFRLMNMPKIEGETKEEERFRRNAVNLQVLEDISRA